jgi:hypothetical protein
MVVFTQMLSLQTFTKTFSTSPGFYSTVSLNERPRLHTDSRGWPVAPPLLIICSLHGIRLPATSHGLFSAVIDLFTVNGLYKGEAAILYSG